MQWLANSLGTTFRLESSQQARHLIPMKVYTLALKRRVALKMDFVQDVARNLRPIRNGLHSIEDIYFRKLIAAMGTTHHVDLTGRVLPTGRQTAKDLFDVYYLSRHHQPVSTFFLAHVAREHAERLIAWYRRFHRSQVTMELLDLVTTVDTADVFRHLDEELLKRLPDRLLA
jgi:hypothetical protein